MGISTKSENEPHVGEHFSILIADDDPSVRELLMVIVSSLGVSAVDYASNGDEAWQMAAERDYSVVFMDVSMPVLSGIEAHKKIKESKPSLPVVFITGTFDEESIIGIIEKENVFGYIKKPFNIAEIESLLARLRSGAC